MDIVVLAGGLSTERDVSFVTGNMVSKALRKNGHRVILLDVFMGYSDKKEDISDIFEHTEEVSVQVEEGLQPGGPLVAANLMALRVVNQINAVGAAGQEPAHLIALQNRTVIQVIRCFGNAKVGPGAVRADAQHGLGNQSVLIVALVCAEIYIAAVRSA